MKAKHQNTSNHFHSKISTLTKLESSYFDYVVLCSRDSSMLAKVSRLAGPSRRSIKPTSEIFQNFERFFFLSLWYFAVSDEESRHIPSTFDSGFVPFIPSSQLETNPFQHHQHHHLDESHETDFYPPQVDHKYYSPYHTTFGSTVRPTGHRVFGRFHSPSTTSTRRPIYQDQSILGSGDFVVMKGGAFYGEGDVRPARPEYYHGGSETRPYALPLTSQQQHDPFANFRDFADITGDHFETDFSHKVLVYNDKVKNVSADTKKHEPNNILEELELIDAEKKREKETKLSKFKTKLFSSVKKSESKTKSRQSNDRTLTSSSSSLVDPLMAESWTESKSSGVFMSRVYKKKKGKIKDFRIQFKISSSSHSRVTWNSSRLTHIIHVGFWDRNKFSVWFNNLICSLLGSLLWAVLNSKNFTIFDLLISYSLYNWIIQSPKPLSEFAFFFSISTTHTFIEWAE